MILKFKNFKLKIDNCLKFYISLILVILDIYMDNIN